MDITNKEDKKLKKMLNKFINDDFNIDGLSVFIYSDTEGNIHIAKFEFYTNFNKEVRDNIRAKKSENKIVLIDFVSVENDVYNPYTFNPTTMKITKK